MRATMPKRLNQLPPMRASRSCEVEVEVWLIAGKVGALVDDGAADRVGNGSAGGAGWADEGGGDCGCGVTLGSVMGARGVGAGGCSAADATGAAGGLITSEATGSEGTGRE